MKGNEVRQEEVSGTRSFLRKCAKDKMHMAIWVAVSRPACLKKGLMLQASATNMVTRDSELVTQHQISCPIVPQNFPHMHWHMCLNLKFRKCGHQ